MNVANIVNRPTTKVINPLGIDVSPKRLTDENFPPIKIIPVEERGSVSSKTDEREEKQREDEKDELEWFKSKIHREKPLESTESQEIETVVPSPEIVEKKKKVRIYIAEDLLPEKPERLYLKLKETDTLWLLSITSGFSQDDPIDAEKVTKENSLYTELTTGEGLTRKRATADTQTAKNTEKSKGTLTAEIKMKDSFVNASAWDLYDTYAQLEGDKALSIKEFQHMMDIALKTKGVSLQQLLMQKSTPEEQITQLFELPPFRYALLITERLLASNNYNQKQSVFKKHLKSKYEDVQPSLFSYDIEELWTFKKEFENPMMVTGQDWNPYNPDLLAVGYGHFHFGEGKLGLVCVWSPKNPGHPEREFILTDPVTSLNYSTTRPNILAVGCRSGDVYIIDVSTEFGNLRILGRDKVKFRHGPVWKVQWFVRKEIIVDSEDLLAVGEGGILVRFTFPDDQETTDILKLQYIASITKSTFQTLQKGSSKKAAQGVITTHTTFSSKSLSGLSFSLLKNGRICYVSTKEGVVTRCVVRDPCRTEGTFLAHNGPIYNIEHSPFTDLIYFTCGSDWNLKIWMDGVAEPLMVLPTQHPVVSARWSPTISTIIATISGSELSLWDIARRTNLPVKVYDFEHGKRSLSTLLFSPKGTNIVVGDQQGHVKVLHLSQLPRQPFLQIEALVSAIERALLTNENLLKKFIKATDQNKDNLKTRVTV